MSVKSASGNIPARAGLALTVALTASGAALGNEFGGQTAYRLGDASERMARANVLDLRERRAGGGYVFNQITNIDRQINCNLSVAATGNAAQPTHAASGIAPIGIQGSGVSANTTGNQSETSNSSQGQLGNASTQYGNGSFGAGQGATGGNLNQVQQGNTGSNLSSGVSGSPLNADIGAIDVRDSEFLNSMETVQSNDGSEILATVTDSGACEFAGTSP